MKGTPFPGFLIQNPATLIAECRGQEDLSVAVRTMREQPGTAGAAEPGGRAVWGLARRAGGQMRGVV